MPITIKKTVRIILNDNSFIGNRIRNDKEVKEAEKKAHKVDIMTKTSVRKSSRG